MRETPFPARPAWRYWPRSRSGTFVRNASQVGAHLRSGLEQLSRHGIIGDIRGKGLFLGVEFVRDPVTRQQFQVPIGSLIGRRALKKGLLTRFDPHWIALGPPLILNTAQSDEIISILDQSITETLAELRQ